MSSWVHGKELKQALEGLAKQRGEDWEEFKKAVRRQHAAGLSDSRMAEVLRSNGFTSSTKRVREAREALGLTKNARGVLCE